MVAVAVGGRQPSASIGRLGTCGGVSPGARRDIEHRLVVTAGRDEEGVDELGDGVL